jgi:hypothetical protein
MTCQVAADVPDGAVCKPRSMREREPIDPLPEPGAMSAAADPAS